MQDKKQLDCYDDSKKQRPAEPFESEQYLPTSYDWRLSNCDERRSGPCQKKYDNVRHTFH